MSHERQLTALQQITEMTLRRMAKEVSQSYPFPWKFQRDRYTENYLVMQFTEQMVQDAIIVELNTWAIDVIAIDSGMKRARGRILARAKEHGLDARELVKFTAGGLPAGFPDLHGTLAPNGRSLYIEVKAPAWIDPDDKKKLISEAGKPTIEQLDFLLSKHERGAIALVAWSVADVTRALGKLADENIAAINRAR